MSSKEKLEMIEGGSRKNTRNMVFIFDVSNFQSSYFSVLLLL